MDDLISPAVRSNDLAPPSVKRPEALYPNHLFGNPAPGVFSGDSSTTGSQRAGAGPLGVLVSGSQSGSGKQRQPEEKWEGSPFETQDDLTRSSAMESLDGMSPRRSLRSELGSGVVEPVLAPRE